MTVNAKQVAVETNRLNLVATCAVRIKDFSNKLTIPVALIKNSKKAQVNCFFSVTKNYKLLEQQVEEMKKDENISEQTLKTAISLKEDAEKTIYGVWKSTAAAMETEYPNIQKKADKWSKSSGKVSWFVSAVVGLVAGILTSIIDSAGKLNYLIVGPAASVGSLLLSRSAYTNASIKSDIYSNTLEVFNKIKEILEKK